MLPQRSIFLWNYIMQNVDAFEDILVFEIIVSYWNLSSSFLLLAFKLERRFPIELRLGPGLIFHIIKRFQPHWNKNLKDTKKKKKLTNRFRNVRIGRWLLNTLLGNIKKNKNLLEKIVRRICEKSFWINWPLNYLNSRTFCFLKFI